MPKYQKHQLDIPLVKGLEQDADPKSPPVRLTTVENLEYTKRNRLEKRRRLSFQQLIDFDNNDITGTTRNLSEIDGRVVYQSRERIYELSQDVGAATDNGPVPMFGFPRKTVVARDGCFTHAAYAACASANYLVYAWVVETDTGTDKQGELWVSVRTKDGVQVLRQMVATHAHKPRLFEQITDSQVVLWWVDGTGAPYSLKYVTVDTFSGVAVSAATTFVAAGISFERRYDACVGAGGGLWVAYWNGTNTLLKQLSAIFTVTNTVTIAESAADGIGIYFDGNNVVIGWSNTTGADTTRAAIYDGTTTATVSAPQEITNTRSYLIGWTHIDTTFYGILGQDQALTGLSDTNRTYTVHLTTAGVAGTDQILWHTLPASRPWVINGKIYAALLHTGSTLEFGLYIALLAYGAPPPDWFKIQAVLLTGGQADWSRTLNHDFFHVLNDCQLVDELGYLFAWGEIFRYTNLGVSASSPGLNWALGLAGISSWFFDKFADSDFQTVALEGALYSSGGVVTQYDGNTAAEVGYAWSPNRALLTKTAGANTWNYAFTYTWLDNLGRWHESSPSQPFQVTSATTPVDIDIQTLTLTNKTDPVVLDTQKIGIRIYRTLNNGTTYRFLAEIENDVALGEVSYQDGATDASIAAQPTLYTDMRVLPHGPPRAASAVCAWDNRIAAAAGERVHLTTLSDTTSAPTFIDHASHWIETHDGLDVVGVASMDDSLVLLKETDIFALQGTGPGPAGDPVLPAPRIISGMNGCVSPLSVVSTVAGIAYQSARGLELLPRGAGAGGWFGEPVQDITGTYPLCQGVMLSEAESRVVWSFTTDTGGTGSLLIWDYGNNAWSTTVLMSETESPPAALIRPIWSEAYGGLVAALSAPQLYVSVDTAGDDGVHVVSTLETNNIRIGQFYSGHGRAAGVRLLGELAGTTTRIVLRVAYDDGEYTDGQQWNFSGNVGDTIMIDFTPAVAKVNSLRLLITDTDYNQAGDPSAGMIWNAITLVVAEHTAPKPLAEAFRG